MKRSILLISDRLHMGGVEAVLQNLAAYLDERGDSVTIWASQGSREELRQHFPPSVKLRRLPFWDGPCRRFSPKWFFFRSCRLLFESFLLKLKKWDAAIAFKEGASMRLASKLRAKKKLAWIHSDYEFFHWSGCEFHNSDAEELACMQRFDKVVCVSRTGADGVVHTLGDPGNLCIRYNPLNAKAITAAALEKPEDCVRPEGKPLFVAVGRLSEVKRYDMLIDVCGELEKEFDFELWLVGGGELEAPLRRKLEDAGIKSVRMLGSRDNPYPYLAAADWFISSSASECHPIALQEALILGIPVVASSCSAVVETLDPRFGILAEHDRQGLREGLREILLRPELTEKCRGNIRAFYDKNSVWEARLEAICELMGE